MLRFVLENVDQPNWTHNNRVGSKQICKDNMGIGTIIT